MPTVNAATFAMIFASAAASTLTWEVGSRCDCYSTTGTRQPDWNCTDCGGLGCKYAAPVTIRALFRAQSRWTTAKVSGERGLGEAQLTTLPTVKPAYTDERIRDRFTVVRASGDLAAGRVFYPIAQPVPFLIDDVQQAWRVQLQGLDQTSRTRPQP